MTFFTSSTTTARFAVWLDQPKEAHGELDFDDVDAMWNLMAELYAENAALSSHKADVEEILSLAVETERENVSLHEELSVLRRTSTTAPVPVASKEPCSKCATLETTLETLRGNYSTKCDDLRKLEKAHRPFEWIAAHPQAKVLLAAIKAAARQLPGAHEHSDHHHILVVAPIS